MSETRREWPELFETRLRFWTQLLGRANRRTSLHASISPGHKDFISKSAGKAGLGYNYGIRQHRAIVELYIERYRRPKEENKEIFGTLLASREQIEAGFGGQLQWLRLDHRRASRIMKEIYIGGYCDEEKWPKIQDAMIDAMIRLEAALRPHVAKLRV